MRHLSYRKKANAVFPVAGVLAAVGIFGACATTAWALPVSGTSVSGNIVVRDEAVDGAQIGSLVDDQEVTVTGVTTGSDGKKWYSITFEKAGQEKDGWVRADLIDTTENVTQDEDEDEDETADTDEDADTSDAGEDTTASDEDEDEDASDEDGETQDTLDGSMGTVRVELESGYVDLTDVPDEVSVEISDRFVQSECTIADGTVLGYQLATADVLVSNDAILTNYYYLYGTNDIGESGWYVYDASQDSLQKSILNMSYSLADTEEGAVTEQESSASGTSDMARMLIAALALVCVLLLILAIVFSVRYRRLRSMLEREDRIEERRTETKETDRTGKKENSRKPENDAPVKQSRKPVEIMDLDDMDDADYEEMLEQYLDEHMPSEDDSLMNADDLPGRTVEESEDLDSLPPLKGEEESETLLPKNDDDNDDNGDGDDNDGDGDNNDDDDDDDLEFL